MREKRPTVALLMDHFLGDYQTALRDAVEMTTRERGVDFLCVIGRPLDSPNDYERIQNQIFDEITPASVSGVIVASANLSLHAEEERIVDFCHGFAPMPICSIGLQIPKVPSVVADNSLISLAVRHLAEDHGCRAFAYIGGPPANQEASVRRNSFLKSLDDLGLAIEPGLMEYGAFTMQSGCDAVSKILSTEKPFDALVAANDTMAMGALSVMKKHGINVPRDVRVTGFDDIPAGRFYSPRLTTLRQRLEEIGRHAVDLVLKQVAGRTAPIVMEVAPRLIRRQSCGCTKGIITTDGFLPLSGDPLADVLRDRRKELVALLVHNVQIPELAFSRWPARLIGALSEEVGGDGGRFTRVLEDILTAAEHRQWAIDELQNAISVLREQFLEIERREALDLESLWHDARTVLMDASARGHLKNQVAADLASALFLRRTVADLPAVMDEEELTRTISEELDTIGIKNGLVSVFSSGSKEQLECVVAVRDGRAVDQRRTTYNVHTVVPPFLEKEERTSYVAIPLSTGGKRLGVMVLESGAADLYYEILREHMTSYLKHTLSAKA